MANGNILYVDEINLLDDHIVDLLLDAAAMGVNFVEREGISYAHPARFLLVGTMNPEEGDLRPQLLDRFGLVVDVNGEKDSKVRSEIIKRRLEFEKRSGCLFCTL
jgi:magnesium chelatase subunit I